ncbi:pyruvate kinase [Faecalitalea cylindroides]|uniref:Pyruvate kinase n=2 Tax=Faecalitalea cylindroides TaxID=39483 RepID=U2P895_9FIRM|nr:pyruvate kinase [Faecalitalea cylindroides]ERK46735.1 pyruvate kinase [[Eubacterium] cylindroides ATCC 27803] [Faecalitalea cylindroides ATCC 27803]MBM6652484.1 pyruvate kinase [Faecalitalea cylindroides]MDB7953047.1 pyruvate kinase [Faecalitalea cylindroides]MDB7959374.1 pyruvate kinase [Faecalitalea cylindroides]MDB7961188.1 pyruvate kinase [Faecalitalea cylindroides]
MMDKKTKIVCTIGPASESKEVLTKLVNEGMNIARLNFSHGSYEEHGNRIKLIREVSKETGKPIGILLDTKGPEIRLGDFENGGCEFKEGDIVRIVKEEVLGNHERFTIRCPEVFNDVKAGDYILMDDGKMKVTIQEVSEGEMTVRVENPHFLKSRKGCNLPGIILSMPFISEKDEADIRFGCRQDIDYIAASFTRRKEDVLNLRKILIDEKKDAIQIIPKIENQEGFDNLREILDVSDGVMVARGDLGVDVSLELVPIYQKRIIRVANELGKPVITATHMLESMQTNPRPTRAEASDVANAIMDGTDGIMLSGESAAGNYPVEAVQTMHKIAVAIEPMIDYKKRLKDAVSSSERSLNDAIGISAADTALAIDIKCIIAFTQSGTTARRISRFRPVAPIIGVCFDEVTQRAMLPIFGVDPYVSDIQNTKENDIDLARNIALMKGYKHGDYAIVVAGYPVGQGSTNMMRIIQL